MAEDFPDPEETEEGNAAEAAEETVEAEKVRLAMVPVGESRIELLEPTSPDSTIAKFLEKRGEGLHHVAIKVPDLNAAVERLRAYGARLLNEPRQGAGGSEGHALPLMQISDIAFMPPPCSWRRPR